MNSPTTGRWRITAVACGLLAALLGAAPSASSAASVVVSPADTLVSVGDDFYVRVEVDAFPDLKGYQLIFAFDPAVVQLVGALPGDVLTGASGAYFAALVPDVVAPADSAWYDAAMLSGSTAGPGVLVYFHFLALAEGVTLLECRRVDFRDSNNVQTLPACTGGQVEVLGVTPAGRGSWGRVKATYR